MIRENPEGLQLIAAVLYQDMSGLISVSLWSDLLQLSKGAPKWILGVKISFSGKFWKLRHPHQQFQKDLKFCTFDPSHNSTVLANSQHWHRSFPCFMAARKWKYFSKITVFVIFLHFWRALSSQSRIHELITAVI